MIAATGTDWVLILLAALLGACALPWLLLALGLRKDPCEPILATSAFFFLIFGIRTVYTLVFGTPFLGTPPLPTYTVHFIEAALFWAVAGFLVFLASYYSSLGDQLAGLVPLLPTKWSSEGVRRVVPWVVAVGVLTFIALVQYFGGWSEFLSDKAEKVSENSTTFFYSLISLVQLALYILYIDLLVRKSGRLVFAATFLLTCAIGLTLGMKSVFLAPLLSLLVIRNYLKRRLQLRNMVLFLGLTVVAMFFFNGVRYAISGETVGSYMVNQASQVPTFFQNLLSRFHQLDSMVFIFRDTPAVMNFQYGNTIWPVVIGWVPRVLWPDKPIISFGKEFADTYYAAWYGGSGTAASPSLIGEGYLNYHLPGLIAMCVLAGIILRAFYSYCILRNRSPAGVFIFASAFLWSFIFWEAGIAGFLVKAAFAVGSSVACIWLISRAGQAPGVAESP